MLVLLNNSVCLVGKRHADVVAIVGSQLPLGGVLSPEANFQNAFVCKPVSHNQMVKEFRGRTPPKLST